MSKFDQFVSKQPMYMRSLPGLMSVSDNKGNILHEEEVPGGLMLDKYVKSLYPNMADIFEYAPMITYTDGGKSKTLGILIIDKPKKKVFRMYTIFFFGRE